MVSMVYANKNGNQVEPDQELVALGLAHIVGVIFYSFPTQGGAS
jgi:MFS superfamily sulfate permease-like transporter